MKTNQTEKTEMLTISIPTRLKRAANNEAKRRGITLSALVKNYLANFLPENIDMSISALDKGAR